VCRARRVEAGTEPGQVTAEGHRVRRAAGELALRAQPASSQGCATAPLRPATASSPPRRQDKPPGSARRDQVGRPVSRAGPFRFSTAATNMPTPHSARPGIRSFEQMLTKDGGRPANRSDPTAW